MRELCIRLVITLILLNNLSIAHSKETIDVATSAYEPYVIEDSQTARGIFPDIVSTIFSQQGVKVKFHFHSWTRGEALVNNGLVFATFPYIINTQRAKSFNFSDPVIYFFPKFFYLKENFPEGFSWHSLKDFKPYIIGGVFGYWYESAFREQAIEVHYVTTDTQNIYKLMHGRIDFTLIDELVGWKLIENIYPQQRRAFAVTKKPESSSTFHLMISRHYPHSSKLTKQFNKGLKHIKANGTYQRIFRRYGVPMEYATSW
ncbi:substrate-binding periplasmic protein [Spartinivicinus poritis]|uniref:Transporter substrate-binding domain-containing protein n=1 Tax=Spartinivicinus poritis TaxID=2994640 RepID=A0ABT5UD30_9GAMM|nr:transporter substrate-binding domain-containing protein [Spartinivicinus sp. A2-2]MDE1464288.1 transporter substrate-binding domain-containing protein [Spartinivicinus sp. A2-2]